MTATRGAIDCDIHPAVPNARVLLPHMDEYWREHMLRRGLERDNFDLSAFPECADQCSAGLEGRKGAAGVVAGGYAGACAGPGGDRDCDL